MCSVFRTCRNSNWSTQSATALPAWNTDFRGYFHWDPYTEEPIRINTTHVDKPNLPGQPYPLIMREQLNRAPEDHLDKDFQERHTELCKNKKYNERWLHPRTGQVHVAAWSLRAGPECIGVNRCWRDRLISPLITELRENHYAFRSREHVENLNALLKTGKVPAFEGFDKTWFSSRLDPMPVSIVDAVQNAVKKLQL